MARAGPVVVRRAAALLLAVLLPSACTDGAALDDPPRSLVIASGEPSGVYYAYARGLESALSRDLPGTDVRTVASSGSVDNLRRVASGEAHLAFALADSVAQAVDAGGVELRALARLYTNSVHVVVRDGVEAERVADLAGLRVSVGSPGSGTELTATRMLAVAGAAPGRVERLGVSESAAAVGDGRLDAFFWSGGLPTDGIADLVASTPVRLLPTADLLAGMRARHGEYVVEQTIPRSVYGTAGEVGTIGVPNLLVVRADLPEQVARAVTRTLFASRDELVAAHPEARYLDPRSAITTTPVELHPGAAAHYRSVKAGVGG